MPNEFENEVRKKMEELNFVPSGPVWEKIEEQIRKKKDRRRGLIWFPMLGIMLAAGIWWMNEGEGRRGKEEVLAGKGQEKTENRLQATAGDRDAEHRESLPLNSDGAKDKKVNFPGAAQSNLHVNINPDAHLSLAVHGKARMATTLSRSKQQVVSKSDAEAAPENNRENGKNEDKDNVINVQVSNTPAASAGSEHRQMSFIPAGKIIIRHAGQVNITAGERNSIVSSGDSQAIQPPSTKKIAARKWRFGVIAGAGFSGSGNGLAFLDGSANKMDAAPLNAPPRPPLINYYSAPTPVVMGPSFTAGFTARKQIGKKLQFITGLQYDYFSTRHDVGIRINQRSANTGVSTNFSPYYINYGATLQEYVNQYHFITLPVTISLRPFGSLPLEWQGGLLVKQLVKTNALKYDSNIEGYYYDRSAFRNTQCYVTTGLSYAFLKQSMLAGPFMEYGLTAPEKQGDAKRLYAYGLKVQYLFTKK